MLLLSDSMSRSKMLLFSMFCWRQVICSSNIKSSLTSQNRFLRIYKLTAKMPENNGTHATKRMCTDTHCGDSGENVTLRFAKLTENAYTPTRGSSQAAGFDLYSAYDCVVPKQGKAIVKTDIQIECPSGCYGRVAPRSGLAAKNFIDVGAGVIDQDYRGNVGVVLFNFAQEDFEIKKGDRIAQLILERIYIPTLEEVPSLTETDRGAGGFGSTGQN